MTEVVAEAGVIFSISIFVVHAFDVVSDALMGIFMGRTVPSADPSTVWLADLIEAAEVLAASAEPCDAAIVRAFSHRLEMPGLPLLPSEVPFTGRRPSYDEPPGSAVSIRIFHALAPRDRWSFARLV
jgi:hypothetical protein